MYVHGGGFKWLSKNLYWILAEHYARHGYLTYCINYSKDPYPLPVQDVLFAWRWVVRDAERLGIDHVFLAGDSAGAALSLSALITMCFKDPQEVEAGYWRQFMSVEPLPSGVILGSPVLNLRQVPQGVPRWVQMLWRTMRRHYDPEDSLLASPGLALTEPSVELVREPPPILTLYGDRDPLIDHLPLLEEGVARFNLDHEVKIYTDQVHAFHIWPFHGAGVQAWEDQMQFLSSCGVQDT